LTGRRPHAGRESAKGVYGFSPAYDLQETSKRTSSNGEAARQGCQALAAQARKELSAISRCGWRHRGPGRRARGRYRGRGRSGRGHWQPGGRSDPMTGRIKSLSTGNGSGCIAADNGVSAHFLSKSVLEYDITCLAVGQ